MLPEHGYLIRLFTYTVTPDTNYNVSTSKQAYQSGFQHYWCRLGHVVSPSCFWKLITSSFIFRERMLSGHHDSELFFSFPYSTLSLFKIWTTKVKKCYLQIYRCRIWQWICEHIENRVRCWECIPAGHCVENYYGGCTVTSPHWWPSMRLEMDLDGLWCWRWNYSQ